MRRMKWPSIRSAAGEKGDSHCNCPLFPQRRHPPGTRLRESATSAAHFDSSLERRIQLMAENP